MKALITAVLISLLPILSCQTRKTTPSFESMNQGELMNDHFFFSLPNQNTTDSGAVITVMINGKERRFMIDTGAPLIISKSLQQEMNFPLLVNTITRDSNGDTSGVKIVTVSDLSLGPPQFKNIPALILGFDLPVFSCDAIDGFIGSNLLRLLVIQFNKREQKVSFADHIDSFRLDKNTSALEMIVDKSQSNPIIAPGLNGSSVDSALFDSGDKTLYTISKLKFQQFREHGQLNNKIMAIGSGVSSQGIIGKSKDTISSFVLQLDSLSLGQHAIKNVYSEPTPDQISRIGRGLWEYGLVTMDYPGRKFYFTPYKPDLAIPPPLQFGFRYQDRNDKLVVTVVWENSEAASCGLKPGFEIVKFGNFIPDSVSICEWSAYCRKEALANTITIKYLNEKGEEKQCMLSKTELNYIK